ncbi:MAG TPA: hypothetical protein VIV56_07310 [Gemmatimonadales bacterium]
MSGRFPVGDNLLLGRGKVYFDRLNADGNSTGERYLGEVSSFEVSGSPETRDKFTFSEPSSGLLKRAVIRQSWEFSLEFNEYDPDNLALALLGEEPADITTDTTPVAAESLGGTDGVFTDRFYQLANVPVDSGTPIVISNTGGPLTVDVDYIMDYTLGRVYIVPGGAINDGDTDVTAAYTPLTATRRRVRAGTQALIEGKLVFIGDNVAGPNYHIEAWRVQMTPDGALALLSDDYGAPKLKGAVLLDATNHPDEPYFRQTLIAAIA